jgi:hypothetical protein
LCKKTLKRTAPVTLSEAMYICYAPISIIGENLDDFLRSNVMITIFSA